MTASKRALALLDGLQTQTADTQRYRAQTFQIISNWTRGKTRVAGGDAGDLLRSREKNGKEHTVYDGLFAFYYAATLFYRAEKVGIGTKSKYEDAAYWFEIASLSASANKDPFSIARPARKFGEIVRDKLDEEARVRLLDRLLISGFITGLDDDVAACGICNDEPDPDGFIDAKPIKRRVNYPFRASQAGVDGFALAEFCVGEDGKTHSPELIYSVPYKDFGRAVERAIPRWRFEPATQDGAPVEQCGIATQFIFEMVK